MRALEDPADPASALSATLLNWSYSASRDAAFTYVPSTDGFQPLTIAKRLTSQVPFRVAIFDIQPWNVADNPSPSPFGALNHRIMFAPTQENSRAAVAAFARVQPSEVPA